MQTKNNPKPNNFLVCLALEAAGIIPIKVPQDNSTPGQPINNHAALLSKLNLTGIPKPPIDYEAIRRAEEERKQKEEAARKLEAELMAKREEEERKRKVLEAKKREKELKRKIENMVVDRLKQEVGKKIEKKVEKIVEDRDGPRHKFSPSPTDRHVIPTPEKNTVTLEQHRRFWEIEKRIQEHKEKYNHTFFDINVSPKDESQNMSYISTLRTKLVHMPPLATQLSINNKSNSQIVEYSEEKYQDLSGVSVLGNKEKENELLHDGYSGLNVEGDSILDGKGKIGHGRRKSISPYEDNLASKMSRSSPKGRIRTEGSVPRGRNESHDEVETTGYTMGDQESEHKEIGKKDTAHKDVDYYQKCGESMENLATVNEKNNVSLEIRTSGILRNVRRQSLSPLRNDYYSNKKDRLKMEKAKRSTSVIEEVTERNLVSEAGTYRAVAIEEEKRTIRPPRRVDRGGNKLDSGSIVRQMFRIRGSSRNDTSVDSGERVNTTTDVTSPNRSYIDKLIRERRMSGDFTRGFGFSSSQRTRVAIGTESPGPKYDLSSYKGMVNTEIKEVIKEKTPKVNRRGSDKGYMYQASPSYAKPLERNNGIEMGLFKLIPMDPVRQNSLRNGRGASFGTAKREGAFSHKRNVPGPGDYDINVSSLRSTQGASFGKEKKSYESSFLAMQGFNSVKFV